MVFVDASVESDMIKQLSDIVKAHSVSLLVSHDPVVMIMGCSRVYWYMIVRQRHM